MNLSTFFHDVLRRWYVLVAGALVTVVLVILIGPHVSPTYSRGATQVLIPGTQSYPNHDNPYLYIGNLTQAADVLIGALNAEKVDSPITSAYPGSTITVGSDPSTSGPMISILVTATSDTKAEAVLSRIVNQIGPVLSSLQEQANVPPTALIKAIPITMDTSSHVNQKARIEAMGGIAVLGLVVTLLLAALIDSLIVSRSRRRARASAAEVDGEGVADEDSLATSEVEADTDTDDTDDDTDTDTDTDTDNDDDNDDDDDDDDDTDDDDDATIPPRRTKSLAGASRPDDQGGR